LALLVPAIVHAFPAEDGFQIIHSGPGLSLHDEMFIEPFTYSDEYDGQQTEIVFQISAKHRMFQTRFYFAYNQISFWQAYDVGNSSPFRDTNYNPQLFYRFKPGEYRGAWWGADAGFEHESNGQRVPESRSWNQVYFTPYYQRDVLLVRLNLRWRIPEEDKETPLAPEGDDNPDITDFMGYTDLSVYYRFRSQHQIHLFGRGNLSTGKGFVSANYSLPIPGGSASYLLLSASHGYGESLLDYDRKISRVGIGIMFTR
jgi:phospholipase A1